MLYHMYLAKRLLKPSSQFSIAQLCTKVQAVQSVSAFHVRMPTAVFLVSEINECNM